MRRGIHLRKRKRFKIHSKFFLLFLFVLFFVFFSIRLLGKNVTPILLETSELEIEKISSIVVNQSISSIPMDEHFFQNLFETVTSSDGTIQTIDFNSATVNKLLNNITTNVLENLKSLENGTFDSSLLSSSYLTENQLKNLRRGVLQEIPIGLITKNPVLSNLGPKIPIRIHYTGDVLSNITTDIKSYGINNALLQVGVHLEVTVQILLPYLTKEKVILFDVPLSIKMIQGKIPTYYSGGISKDSLLHTLPID